MTVTVFLSASIPIKNRHERFWKTADNQAIRDAIKGLVEEVIYRDGKIVFGGHPAITPLISHMFKHLKLVPSEHVILYQSRLFASQFPSENKLFPQTVITDVVESGDPFTTRKRSLELMRRRMFSEHDLDSAFFIGGMEGIFEEYELLSELRPSVRKHPIASTGAAALIAYEKYGHERPELVDELTYPTLFRRLLDEQPIS